MCAKFDPCSFTTAAEMTIFLRKIQEHLAPLVPIFLMLEPTVQPKLKTSKMILIPYDSSLYQLYAARRHYHGFCQASLQILIRNYAFGARGHVSQ